MSNVNDLLREVDRRERRVSTSSPGEAAPRHGRQRSGPGARPHTRRSTDAKGTQRAVAPMAPVPHDDPGAYLKHFRLQQQPFHSQADEPADASLAACRVALNALRAAIAEDRGVTKVTGAPGTGKSLLCRQLLASLDAGYRTVYVGQPHRSLPLFLLELVMALPEAPRDGPPRAAPDLSGTDTQRGKAVYDELKLRLLGAALEGKRVVLCVDEAQRLPRKTLELLRRLSELSLGSRKCVHLLLAGRPELDQRLEHASMRALRKRIASTHVLAPMSAAEVSHYLDYRMASAGYYGSQPTVFTRSAKWLIRWHSGGAPGQVNVVADEALKWAYDRGRTQVSVREILSAMDESPLARPRSTQPALKVIGLGGVLGFLVAELARIV